LETAGKLLLLDRLGIVLPKRMRLAEHELQRHGRWRRARSSTSGRGASACS
jgi:hypothetical protein